MIQQLIEDIRSSGSNVFDLTLVRDGEWEHAVATPTAPCQNNFSLTKNFIATGIGLLQDMGRLSVEDPILQFFSKDERAAVTDPKMEQVKIRHLLSQTMGLEKGFLFEVDRFLHDTNDWLAYTLSQPLAYEPGTRFTYSNSTFYLLSCIIHRVSGLTADRFLLQNLFAPLNILDFAVAHCPKGEMQGGTGLYMTTDDIAKLGVLYLNKGLYDGRRVLSAQWVEEATRRQVPEPDLRACGYALPSYGYSFWTNEVGFEGNGAYQQMMLVVPEKKLVLAAHAFADAYDYIGLLRRHGLL